MAGLTLLSQLSSVQAEELRLGFDGPKTAWQFKNSNKSQVTVLKHSHSNFILTRGKASECYEISNKSKFAERTDFILNVPPARVISELKLSVWYRSNRPVAGCWLRVVLPNQADPREEGQQAKFYVPGTNYKHRGNQWQQLTCQTDETTINRQLQRLRSELNFPHLDYRGMYVDQVLITTQIPAGVSEFYFDELRMSPVVKPSIPDSIQQASAIAPSQAVQAWEKPFDFRLDRSYVQGKPFFPSIMASHGESAAALKLSGANTVWISDYRDTNYLTSLRREGLWATATPPYISPEENSSGTGVLRSPVPFDRQTSPILFWMLGARVPVGDHKMLLDWKQQVRRADQEISRPITVDVIGNERKISRHFPMLSFSRHPLHTSMSFDRYREYLTKKIKQARPGTFAMTWLQTEPASRFLQSARSKLHPLVVEPEQIRLQYYLALQAGCRGVGFWKTTPLEAAFPGAYERRLAITQLNLERTLIEPWICSGNLNNRVIPFETEKPRPKKSSFNLGAKLVSAEEVRQNRDPRETVVEGVLVKSEEYGSLLLAVCYNKFSQYVPGTLSAKNVSVIVPSVPETASAWLVTPTGLKSLDRKFVAGGAKVTLARVDQTALVVLTSNRNQINQLEEKIAQIAERSAQTSYDLAQSKLTRVKVTIEKLTQQGLSQQQIRSLGQADIFLLNAENHLSRSENFLQLGHFHESRRESTAAMRLVRNLQFSTWYETVFPRLSTPASSPYTIAFSSLPEHWEMVKRIGRSNFDTSQNLLELGDFEAEQTIELIDAGWENYQQEVTGVASGAMLTREAKEGDYALRLAAYPAVGVGDVDELPLFLDKTPVRFKTPAIPVKAGQLLYVSGWLRVQRPIVRSDDGFLIYDSLGGQVRALRWFDKQEWRHFSFIREATNDDDFQLTLELTGMGEVHLDDLSVIPITPRSAPRSLDQVDNSTEEKGANPLSKPFKYLNSLPGRLNPFKKREKEEKQP